MTDLATLQSEFIARIEAAESEAALEAVRVAALGKKGSISELLSTLGRMAPEERKTEGAKINALKDSVAARIAERRAAWEAQALEARLSAERLDPTLPAPPSAQERGRVHPVSQVMEELAVIFADMGFAVAEGPDIETDDRNFIKLNVPEGHPAREMQDTFYFPPGPDGERKLLRTHTSPVQVRTMLKEPPPLRVICPGRVYRCDSDRTHTPMFHQIEGLVVDESTHMGHLKWVLEEFLKAFFEVKTLDLRFRPSFFPFTEPSMEVDVRCRRGADEVRIGEGDDFMEILGCGMVHPKVLKNCGLDPDVHQGFAFGVGLDRLAMLKYGMPDLRAFFDGDLRWLEHYGFRTLDVPSLAGGLSG